MATVVDIMDTTAMVIMVITMAIMGMDIGEDVAVMDITDTMDVASEENMELRFMPLDTGEIRHPYKM